MAQALERLPRHLDYPGEIEDLLTRIERDAKRIPSPKRMEYEFCGLLAAWEAVTLRDRGGSRWRELWERSCKKRHGVRSGRTLADPVQGATLSERWQVSSEETSKAYKSVMDGMRRVFKSVLKNYQPEREGQIAHLWQLIDDAFKTGKSFASPEALEAFLLVLIGVFERSLGGERSKRVWREQWQVEIQRKRFVGPAATRTLADVVPQEDRTRRQDAFSDEERMLLLRQMIPPMREIFAELKSSMGKWDVFQENAAL